MIKKPIYLLKYISIILISSLISITPSAQELSLNDARKLFLEGKYTESIKAVKNNKDIRSKIFRARVMSINAHYFLNELQAKTTLKKAIELAKEAILIDPKNDQAYIELAHALGRYSQNIGIMQALARGLADKVYKNLDIALNLNPENVIAHISKGTWNAEIVNKAGSFMAKTLYKATAENARKHYSKAEMLLTLIEYDTDKNPDTISPIVTLYEIAYGYSLLEEEDDIINSKRLLSKIISIKSQSHLDDIIKNLSIKLSNNLEKWYQE